MTRSVIRILLAATLCSLLPRAVLGQAPIEAPLADRLPALADQSSWAQDTTLGDAGARRGCYAIGNGRVFAWSGTGATAAELMGVTGPRYQTAKATDDDGQFGSLVVELHAGDGTVVTLPEQRVRRVRGAAFVVTEDASDRLALRTLTFAPTAGTSILRVIEVVNLGDAPLDDLTLSVHGPAFAPEGDGLTARHGDGARAAVATIRLEGGSLGAGALERPVGTLAPGAHWLAVLDVLTASGREAPVAPQPTVDAAATKAESTLAAWRDRLASTLEFDSDRTKLADLVNDWKVMLCVLHDAQSGVFVPAQYRRIASVRENNGALVAALRLGLWDEAKSVLEFWWNATRLTGEVPDEVPLDLDFTGIDADRTATTEFWKSVRVPPSGAPAYILLQHLWYWRTTGDTELIERHWPLLDVCLKRQRRGPDDMLAFSGDEPWLKLAEALGKDAPEPPLFAAEDPAIGRRSWSFENSVLFMMSLHATGELVDALDEARHPERWADGRPDDRPSTIYAQRAFDVMKGLEKRFWIEDGGFFAPAVSPVDGAPHRSPIAEANLLPLWIGWTFPTGEKSRDNLRNSLARLWRDGARIGSTPTVGYATGDLQGRLLTALSERDGARRLDVIDSLLDLAEPAGEWPSFVDPDGNAFGVANRERPERLSPGIGGTNVDAILFAISGIRHLAVPNWDDDDIRLKLRLPHDTQYVTMRGSKKDRRELNLFFRRERSMLTEEEQKANDQLAPEKRRDPTVPHDRLRFVVELVKGDPRKGYYDVGLNAEGTMFVRYLQSHAPASPEQPDLRKIEEMEFSNPDTDAFLPAGDAKQPEPLARHVMRAKPPELLVLTCRPTTAETIAGDGVTIFDTGLPFLARDLQPELVTDDGQAVHARLFLDWDFDAPPPATWTPPAFWTSAAWRDTLAAYRKAGGIVIEPGFVSAIEWAKADDAWRAAQPTSDGGVLVPAGARRVRFTVDSQGERDGVLRVGASAQVAIGLRGASVLDYDGGGRAVPDSAAALVHLAPGPNAFDVTLTGAGPLTFYARVTDARGLPLDAGD